jgi:Icc-related predicted phosphoesterase
MKILCFADLHQNKRMNIEGSLSPEAEMCIDVYRRIRPDVVLIAGDIYEYSVPAKFIYKDLATIFPDTPVVCCLGNHEFFYRTVFQTLKDYRINYKPQQYNVHYLDVVKYHDIGNVRFLGNVLWYDGSMCTVEHQNLQDFARRRWMDCTIMDFDFVKECKRNMKNIVDNIAITDMKNILVTHCVPHHKMNGHMFKADSPINAYSGVYDFIDKVKLDYSISGHTHWDLEEKINGCMCYNIGNDYFTGGEYVKFKVIEV